MDTRNIRMRIVALLSVMLALVAMSAAGSASAAPRANGFSTPKAGTFIVSVIDAKTKELVGGAEIEILDANANVVAKAVVGDPMAETDTVTFTLEQGAYKMYITAEGYQKVEAQVSVTAGQTTKSQVELQK